MFSIKSALARNLAIAAISASGAMIAAPAAAQVAFLGTTGGYQVVCTGGFGGNILIRDSDCSVGGTGLVFPTGLQVGNATFNDSTDAVNFTGGTVSFSSVTTAFGGGSVSFNAPVTFTGSSATFSTPTTFNNAITANGISNTGAISTTGALTAGSATISGALSSASLAVGTGGLTIAAGANVSAGGNQVHNVAAGTAATDAANVGQLNAVTGNVTALQTTVSTQGTQIVALQTTTSTQATQITALQAADTAFDSRVDTLELLAIDLDDRIDRVDDRASAGTAAAVALSGAMFLPGKSFNLTGNVGTYRGAHAAALQFGALVSDRMAINAGIAHGFNKGGKTALRAGFTIGW